MEPAAQKGPPEPDEDGNYDSPALKALSQVWEDFCDEEVGPEEVLGVIHEVGGFAHFQIQTLEAQIDQGISDPDNEAFALIFEGFELLLEAAEIMLMEFAEELPEDVEEPEDGFFTSGFDLVQEATNQIVKGHNLAMEHIEAMAEVSCPFCQHVNSRDNQKCGKCGRPLPVSSGMEAQQGSMNVVERQGLEKKPAGGGEGGLTRNYAQTAHMLEGWKAGAVGAEQLAHYLDGLEANFQGHLQETIQQAEMIKRAPQEQQEGLFQALDMTQRGLEMSLESIAKMRLAFDNEDDRYLFFGLSDLEEASKVLVEAYWANKKAAGKS